MQYQALDVRKNFISGAEQHPNFILATDPLHYPFEDDHFDIVFSDQVMAHVEYFWAWYGELKRITKPGGYIITINSQSYPSCPSPIDAWRIHSDGMRSLNTFYGLKTELSLTASLEMEQYHIPAKTGYYYPGASIKSPLGGHSDKNLRVNLLKRNWNNLVGRIPKLRTLLLNPVQVSFDTITIAKKV